MDSEVVSISVKAIEIMEALRAPFPPEEIREREGPWDPATQSRKMLRYIDPPTAIRRLASATGGVWDFEIKDYRILDHGLIAVCIGTLTIPGLGSRDSIGTCAITPPRQVTRQGGDTYWVPNEDSLKGAVIDCVKRCAVLFEMGLDLYADAPPDHGDAIPSGGAAAPVQIGQLPSGVQRGVQGLPGQGRAQSPAGGPQNAPQGQSSSGGGSARPITEPQTRKVWAVCKNLDIDINSNAFNDAVALRFNAPYVDMGGEFPLTSAQASGLIDLLDKNPQGLMPNPVGFTKHRVMSDSAADYWLHRLAQSDVQEATELMGVISAFYDGVPGGRWPEFEAAANRAGVA